MDEERSVWGRVLFVVIGMIFVIILVSLFHANCQLTSVTVNNHSSAYTEEQIKQMVFNNTTDRYAIFFRLRWLIKKQENIPFIEKIEAKLLDKNTIELSVYEKRIIGCVFELGQYFYFDRDGYVVESSSKKLREIPLVEGLEYQNMVLHKKLEIAKEALFKTTLDLTRVLSTTQLEVEKVTFLDDYSLVLFIGQTEVRLGRHDSYDYAILALPDLLEKLDDKNVILYMEQYDENNLDIIARKKEKK